MSWTPPTTFERFVEKATGVAIFVFAAVWIIGILWFLLAIVLHVAGGTGP